MDCQSEPPLKVIDSAHFSAGQLEFGVPYPGQCLNVGIDGRSPATRILVSAKHAVIPVWPNECTWRTFIPTLRVWTNSTLGLLRTGGER